MRKLLVVLAVLVALGSIPVATSRTGEAAPQEQDVLREWDVFDDVKRDANVVYNSATVKVNEGDRMVKFAIVDFDLVNEPSTTVIYFTIERSEDGKTWHHMVGGDFHGKDGNHNNPRPPGTIATNVDNIPGQLIRGTFYFDTDQSHTKKFRVEGKITE